jgi:four helix bundle protein
MRFDAYDAALEMERAARGPIECMRMKDASLAAQMTRSATSVPLNIREGCRRVGKDRLHLYRVAAGSADEMVASLEVAEALGYLERSPDRAGARAARSDPRDAVAADPLSGSGDAPAYTGASPDFGQCVSA